MKNYLIFWLFFYSLSYFTAYSQGLTCATATNLPVNTSSPGCGPLTSFTNTQDGTITPAPPTSTCTAPGTAYQDVWFTITGNGQIINTSIVNAFGAGGVLNIYSSCSGGLLDCEVFVTGITSPPTSFVSTAGVTYYVQIRRYGGTATTDQAGSVCCYSSPPPPGTGPCGWGTSTSNDFCANATPIFEGSGNVFGSSVGYTQDSWPQAGYQAFCGSVENNQWFQFTANSTTETFNISVPSCLGSAGMQAAVFNVSYTGSCCTDFNIVSNCISNIAPGSSGIVSASGLTIGNSYLLMLDGNGGAQCDFTIANWSTSVALPVELIDFSAIAEDAGNLIFWSTQSEFNTDFFSLFKSYDGFNYELITKVDATGNSNSINSYQYLDKNIRPGVSYYHLRSTDFNGQEKNYDIVSIESSNNLNNILFWPNPADNYIQIYAPSKEFLKEIKVLDLNGRQIELFKIESNGNDYITFDIINLIEGIYFMQIETTTEIRVIKFLKEKK